MQKTIGELVRKQEDDFKSGTTQISDYVSHSLHETLEQIDAYHNSKFISGNTDSEGKEKPFFNITVASTNVWQRATDIDRSWIKVRATKSKDWVNSFLANVRLQEWMKKERFGSFLNEWGRVLAKYGSAVVKFVKNKDGLHISVVPWSNLIIDAVDFDANPVIEPIELTEAQLRRRIDTHGYDKKQVEGLINAFTSRETRDGQKKDNKSDYIKLYEVHGDLPLSMLTGEEDDKNTYVQQMHIISFVGQKKGKVTEYKDFTLYSGKEEKSPYMITHLIKEDGRTLAKGAVEYLFEPQWMVNHSMKAIKDNLDLASKNIFQTADQAFVGRNVLNNIESGDILIHDGHELTQIQNSSMDVVSLQNNLQNWKSLGQEMTSVSEAMLGVTPKSGTAWRQTEAVLQESHSLFELMTENKGLYIIDMFREWILPYIKTTLNSAEEIATTLEQYDIDKIDRIYIKNKALKQTNQRIKDKILDGETFEEGETEMMLAEETMNIKDKLSSLGNQRFVKPDELTDKTWKEQLKDFEWDLDVDVTNENRNLQEVMTTLQTALTTAINPAFATNKKAQMIVGRILELSGAMSPIEYNSIPDEQPIQTAEQPNLPATPVTAGALIK